MTNRFYKKELHVILLLFLLTSLFFWNVLIHPDKMMYSPYSDIVTPFSAWKHLIADTLHQYYELPLWNPHAYSGTPFIANVQSTMFYPLFIPLLFLPVNTTFGFIFFLHIFLAGVFCYMFMRYLNVDKFGSLISAIVFMFTGSLIVKLYSAQLLNIATIAWIPLIFLTLEIALRKGSLKYACLTGIVIALQFLSGQTQIFLYSVFSLFLYFLYRLFLVFKEKKNYSTVFKYIQILIVVIVVTACLSAIQALPMFEITDYFYRTGGVGYEFASAHYSIAPEQLITLLAPEFFGSALGDTYQGTGNFWESTFYVGILPLILAISALIFRRNKYTIFFAALAVFAMLFSFGRYTPLFSFFYHFVPGFDMFRQPGKMLIIFSFSIAVLAGFGSSFFSGKFDDKNRKRMKKITKILAIITILVLLGTCLAAVFGDKIISLGKNVVESRYAQHISPEFSMNYYFNLIETIYNGILNNLYVLSALFLSIIAIFILRLKGINMKYVKLLIIIVIITDLWIFGIKYIDVIEPDKVFVKNDVILFLEKDPGLYRVFALNNSLPVHLAYPANIQLVEGYDPVPLRDYMEFEYNIINFTLTSLCKGCYPSTITKLCANGCYPQLLDLLNVKYVITTNELTDNKFELKFNRTVHYGGSISPKHVYLYENKRMLERVFFVPNAIVRERENVMETLKSENFDYINYVILEKNISNMPEKPNTEESNVSIIYYSPNKVKIEANTSNPGFLVLSDVWYPGWEAYADCEQTEIYRTDYILKSVYLEPGNHNVVFNYNPLYYRVGLYITITTILVLIVIFFLCSIKKQ